MVRSRSNTRVVRRPRAPLRVGSLVERQLDLVAGAMVQHGRGRSVLLDEFIQGGVEDGAVDGHVLLADAAPAREGVQQQAVRLPVRRGDGLLAAP